MTTADAPAPSTSLPSSPALPRGVTTARKRFGPDWTVHITHGTGTTQITTRGEPRADGTRPNVSVDVPCQSIGLRARHPDRRAAVAVWVHRLDPDPTGKPRPWSFSSAWRWLVGDHGHPVTWPVQLNAAELGAYVAEPVVEAEVLDLFTARDEDERAAA